MPPAFVPRATGGKPMTTSALPLTQRCIELCTLSLFTYPVEVRNAGLGSKSNAAG